jgi:hypothetical protein
VGGPQASIGSPSEKPILEFNASYSEERRLQAQSNGLLNPAPRFQAVLAALAEKVGDAVAANFVAPATLPPIGSPSGNVASQMAASVERAVEFGQQGGRALAKRAVLWQTARTGEPLEAQRLLPPSAAWIKDGTATHTSTFYLDGDATHRFFTLFESDAEPKRGDSPSSSSEKRKTARTSSTCPACTTC